MAQPKVIIYSTPTCPYCNMAKEYFKKNNIEYTDYNVQIDIEKRKEMLAKSGQLGIPVILIDDQVIIGFNKPKVNELLGLAK
jgi:glutaredoxin-like YruB-family protein